MYLRNKLWTEIFGLIGALLESGFENRKDDEALMVISNALSECGSQPFLQTLCESIDNNEFKGNIFCLSYKTLFTFYLKVYKNPLCVH